MIDQRCEHLTLEMISEVLEEPEPLSILELQGLGKELWADVDAAGHVDAERRAWD